MLPSPRSPIGLKVSEYLQQAHPVGLSVSEIYNRLVSDMNYGGTKQMIVDMLANHSDVYAKGATGHWLDAVLVAADGGMVTPPDSVSVASASSQRDEPLANDRPPQRPGRFSSHYVVFDLETLKADALEKRRIIEVSALKFEAGTEIDRFQTFVNPGQAIGADTQSLTHISDDQVADAPLIEEVLPRFQNFITDLPLVAHNGRSFDLPTLNYWCRFHRLPEITNNMIDTLDLALVSLPTEPILNLSRVNEILQLAPFAAHRAEADVAALAEIFKRLLQRLATQPRNIRQAINAFYAPFVLVDDIEELTPSSSAQAVDASPKLVAFSQYASAVGVKSIFAQGGILAEQMGKGYEDRPSQTTMAELTWRAFADSQYWLIEAPTGTGKTDAYMFPSIVWALSTGQKVFISSHTKQLQDQICKAIDKAQDMGFPVRYAVLKGRTNYVCWTRWRRLVDQSRDPLLRVFLLSWRNQTRNGNLDEFPATLRFRLQGGPDADLDLRDQLYADSEICDRNDPMHAACPYHGAVRKSWDAHLVVINHALLLTAEWGTKTRPPIGYLVCDEAHNLEDAATLAVQKDTNDRDLEKLAELSNAAPLQAFQGSVYQPIKQALQRHTNQLRFHLRAFSDGLIEFVRQQTYESETDARFPLRYRLQWGDVVRDTRGRWAPVKSAHTQMQQHLRGMVEQMTLLIDQASIDGSVDRAMVGEMRVINARLKQAVDFIDDALNLGNANNVYWVELPAKNDESPRFRWAIHRAPIKTDWFLRKQLYEQVKALVLTSATLTVNRGFDFYLNRFGLDRAAYQDKVHCQILPSVFQTKEDILFAIPQNIGRYHPRRAAEFVERASQEVHQLLHLQPKRSLLLFNARERMQNVYDKTANLLAADGLEPAVQEKSGVSSQIDNLRRNEHHVQFGLKMMWEGVDVPGMSYVMIEKLPFPLFFDPVVAARMERAKKETGSDFYGYTLPLTVIQFKQGFGRLYRRNGDHGVVVLLDRSLRRASYRDIVIGSLPEHTFTPASEEALYAQIKQFFGGSLTDADLLRQRTPFERSLEEYTLRQGTFTGQDYERIRPKLLAGLQAFFDFPGFIGKQEEIIRAVLSGKDTLGILPTGGGKSLTFQLPAILREGLTLVVSPLIALMKDQVDKLRDEKNIHCVDYLVSGQASSEQDEILQHMVDGKLRLVYVSPERFRDRRLHEALAHCKVIQFVVDEAHCVSMWGHDFRPDFLYVHDTITRLGRPPVVALTATATPSVKTDIKEQLHMHVSRSNEIVDSFDRPNLRFIVQECRTEPEKERWLMRLLYRSTEPAIVYVATRRESDLIASMLRDRGIAARAYHAGMERYDRDVLQEMFMNDQVRVVVATNAFGMGVDKPDIGYVIHYHFPANIESFYQEAGRAGRSDQMVAYSIVLYTPRDRRIQEYFIQKSIPSPQVLNALFDFFRQQSGDTLYLSDEDLADALPFEEQAVRIGLHILEREEYIRRGYDFASGCAIKIFEPVTEVLNRVEVPERRQKLEILLKGLKIADYGEKRGVNLARLCNQTGLDLEETELFLIELNRAELLSFRTWEKGYTIAKQPRLEKAERLVLNQPKLLSQVENARRKLQQMIEGYLETPNCRRVAILNYFGEKPRYDKCHKCDRCGLPEDVPWSQSFDVDLPDLFTVYHPGYVAIEAASHFHGQFGRTKVIYTLIGQSFNPFDKKALSRTLTDSEYFKALRGYKYEEVRDFFKVLEAKGYVASVSKEIEGKSLPMIGITEKGVQTLEQGDTRSLPTIVGN